MKLKTEMVDGDVFARGKSSLDKLRRLRHDAMAAHALLQATKGVESDYADRKEIVDACEVIRLRAAEILASWGVEKEVAG